MNTLVAFLLLLGPLIVIHELGHLLVAKLLGVKCLRFSVGFGPALFRYQFGETEYVLASLPLGGYVRMLGEMDEDDLPEADKSRALNAQTPLRRILIYLAGPGMNVVAAVFVMWVMLVVGRPVPTTKIAHVMASSPAAEAGMQPGDRIVAIEGEGVRLWSEMAAYVSRSDGRTLRFTVDRGSERIELPITPRMSPETGTLLIGVFQGTVIPTLVFAPGALGEQQGLANGDRVVSVNGTPIAERYQLADVLSRTTGPLEITVERTVDGATQTVTATLEKSEPGPWSYAAFGAIELDFWVQDTLVGLPGALAGIEPRDILYSIEGKRVLSAAQVGAIVEKNVGQPLDIEVLRGGEKVALTVTPMEKQFEGTDDPAIWGIGVKLAAASEPGEMVTLRVANPFEAAVRATEATFERGAQILSGIGMLISQKIGLEQLSGPLGIAQIAGQAFEKDGWDMFLNLVVAISLNLAILNLLPIPILDGGQIVFAAAEAVSGGPLGIRAQQIAQAVGLSLILLLMGVAFWNDIARNWSSITAFFAG
jgi:regulator of sigma E protease